MATSSSSSSSSSRRSSGSPIRSRRGLALGVTALVALVVGGLYVTVVMPWQDSWGATAADRAMALPGDELVPRPIRQVDHVVAVQAPAGRVWPYLAQLGQDRAGFYSYDWLENIALAGIHNHPDIRPEWQTRQIGELVPAVQGRYLGFDTAGKVGWKVNRFQPNAALGLADWGVFALVEQPDGTTRLVARGRQAAPTPAALWPVVTFLLEPIHFVMERRMLLYLAELAEGRAPQQALVVGAALGWLMGAAALGLSFARRRRWVSLGASLAVGAVVLLATGDPQGALAAYMGLGLALLGVVLFRWWAGLWIVALGVMTYAVLALAPDAWLVFGWLFGLAAVGAGLAAWRAANAQHTGPDPLTSLPTAG
jgi:hypothetical protein